MTELTKYGNGNKSLDDMGTRITRKETPEERELNKKLSELAALESKLAQSELDLAMLALLL